MTRILSLIIPLTFSSLSLADFDQGLACYEKQNYACVLNEWKPLANQGDASAQYYLGFMHFIGEAVTQDDREAKRLFGLACNGRNADGCKGYNLLNEQDNTNSQGIKDSSSLAGLNLTTINQNKD